MQFGNSNDMGFFNKKVFKPIKGGGNGPKNDNNYDS